MYQDKLKPICKIRPEPLVRQVCNANVIVQPLHNLVGILCPRPCDDCIKCFTKVQQHKGDRISFFSTAVYVIQNRKHSCVCAVPSSTGRLEPVKFIVRQTCPAGRPVFPKLNIWGHQWTILRSFQKHCAHGQKTNNNNKNKNSSENL